MSRLIKVTIVMIIITSYALVSEMQITQTGFYPNDSFNNKVNNVKEIDGDLYCIGSNQLILKLLGNNKWNYISGKYGGIEYYDLVSTDDKIFIAGDSNKIFVFDKKWQKISIVILQNVGKLSHLEILNNIITCSTLTGEIWYSQDFGLSWAKLELDFPVNNINIYNNNYYFPSTEGRIFEYDNQLKYKTSFSVDTNVVLKAIHNNNEKMFAVGLSNYFYRSDEGGKNFKKVRIGSKITDVNSFEYIDDTTLLAGCSGGLLVYIDNVTKWKYLIPSSTKSCLIRNNGKLYTYGDEIEQINEDQLTSKEAFTTIFETDNYQFDKLAMDYSNNKNEFIIISQNSSLYRYKTSNLIVDKIYKNPININESIVEDDVILFTDQYISYLPDLRSTLTILNKTDFSIIQKVSVDSGLSFDKIAKQNDDYYLYRYGDYFFKYNIKDNKLIKNYLPDGLKPSLIKSFNNMLYFLAYDAATKKYLLAYQNDIDYVKTELQFEDSFSEFFIDKSNQLYFLSYNDKDCGESHRINSFLKKYNTITQKSITLDSLTNQLGTYDKILPFSTDEFFVIGKNTCNYTNDNFKTIMRYPFPVNIPFNVIDVKKIENKFYALIDNKLYILEISGSSIKLFPSENYSIYPNPIKCGSKLSINMAETLSNYTIRVFDINGYMLISDQNKTEITLPDNLISGTYFLVIESDGKYITKEKFIVE